VGKKMFVTKGIAGTLIHASGFFGAGAGVAMVSVLLFSRLQSDCNHKPVLVYDWSKTRMIQQQGEEKIGALCPSDYNKLVIHFEHL
jgi:hypothetical protein